MIFGIPVIDILIVVLAVLLVGLAIFTIINRKKNCHSCQGCPHSEQCKKKYNGNKNEN